MKTSAVLLALAFAGGVLWWSLGAEQTVDDETAGETERHIERAAPEPAVPQQEAGVRARMISGGSGRTLSITLLSKAHAVAGHIIVATKANLQRAPGLTLKAVSEGGLEEALPIPLNGTSIDLETYRQRADRLWIVASAPGMAPTLVAIDELSQPSLAIDLRPGVIVSGVVRSVTGRPISRAHVVVGDWGLQVPGGWLYQMTTEGDGRFVTSMPLERRNWMLRITAPGYAPVTKRIVASEDPVFVEMEAGMSITGTVTSETMPVVGPWGTIVLARDHDSRRVLARSIVNDKGRFALSVKGKAAGHACQLGVLVPPGKPTWLAHSYRWGQRGCEIPLQGARHVSVSVTVADDRTATPRYGLRIFESLEYASKVWFPSAMERTVRLTLSKSPLWVQAVPLERQYWPSRYCRLDAGGIAVRLELGTADMLSVFVCDTDGNPIDKADVEVFAGSHAPDLGAPYADYLLTGWQSSLPFTRWDHGRADKNGVVELRFPSDAPEFSIRAQGENFLPGSSAGLRSTGAHFHRIELQRGTVVTGRLRGLGGRQEIRSSLLGVLLRRNAPKPTVWPAGVGGAPVKGDGTFTLGAVPPGEWRVSVVRLSTTIETLDEPLCVARGDEERRLDIDAGQLRVAEFAGAIVETAGVEILTGSAGFYRKNRSGEAGTDYVHSVRIKRGKIRSSVWLPGGRWMVVVRAKDGSVRVADNVTLMPGRRFESVITAYDYGLKGIALHRGQPLVSTGFSARAHRRGTAARVVQTAPDGGFVLRNCLPGRYVLTLKGGASAVIQTTPLAGQKLEKVEFR